MANVFIESGTMTAIGNAIRAKTGGGELILPADMPSEISNITTGEGGSAGDGVAFVATPPSGGTASNKTTKIGVFVRIPVDAVIQGGVVEFTVNEIIKSTFTTKQTQTVRFVLNSDPVLRETLGSDGTKWVYLWEKTAEEIFSTFNDGDYFTISSAKGYVFGMMPNAYIQDNILYAKPECKALFSFIGLSSFVGGPYYLDGIDMRGSQVKTLPDYCFKNHMELKKMWFSEQFTGGSNYNVVDGAANLEEIHFTATAPSKCGSSFFTNLVTTCKIYVPTGTLAAYASAGGYPSQATYTYLEE